MTYEIVNTTTGKVLESWDTGAQALWAMLNLIEHCRRCGTPNNYRVNGMTAWTVTYVEDGETHHFTTLAEDQAGAIARLLEEYPEVEATHVVEGRIR